MLAKPQGFPRKLGGCAGLDPRLRSAVSAGVGDGERGLRRGLRAPGVGVRPKWVLEYSPSNKRIRYFVSITYVRTGLWTAHKFCGGGKIGLLAVINVLLLTAVLVIFCKCAVPSGSGIVPDRSGEGPHTGGFSDSRSGTRGDRHRRAGRPAGNLCRGVRGRPLPGRPRRQGSGSAERRIAK